MGCNKPSFSTLKWSNNPTQSLHGLRRQLQFVDLIRARCLRFSWNVGRKVAIHQPERLPFHSCIMQHGYRSKLDTPITRWLISLYSTSTSFYFQLLYHLWFPHWLQCWPIPIPTVAAWSATGQCCCPPSWTAPSSARARFGSSAGWNPGRKGPYRIPAVKALETSHKWF